MVVIKQTDTGNWVMEIDWAIPERVEIEDGEIQLLRDVLVQIFGPGDMID